MCFVISLLFLCYFCAGESECPFLNRQVKSCGVGGCIVFIRLSSCRLWGVEVLYFQGREITRNACRNGKSSALVLDKMLE